VFYGLFVIAIFLGFRRGVVQTLVALVRRLGRSRAPATELDAAPDPR
jgi:hypothetical protein